MKPLLFLPIYLGLVACLNLNCQVVAPSVGYVRYTNGGVRGVYGLEGNYIIGGDVLRSAGAASFSDGGGLIFNGGSLSLVDSKLGSIATTEVNDTDALLRVDEDPKTAIAWLPTARVLVHWNGESFVKVAVTQGSLDGKVTSVRKLDANTASLLIAEPDFTVVRYQVSLQTGQLADSTPLPGVSGYAFENKGRTLCFKDGKLSVVSPTGDTLQVLSIAVDSDFVVEQASSRCLHIATKTTGQNWLLHFSSGDVRLYRLPVPQGTSAPLTESAQ